MRYSRRTPEGEVFNFSCPAADLPLDTESLSLGLRKGLIKPDVLGFIQDNESDEEAFKRLRQDLLDRLGKLPENRPLEKDYEAEKTLRHNINWIAIEDL